MKRSHEINMTEGAILPKLLQFSLPILLMSILQNLFNAADVVIVGKFASGEAMAAVGSTAYLLGFLITLFAGISSGTNILCARCFGRHDREQLSQCLHTSILFSLIFSLPISAGGILCSGVIPKLLNVDPAIADMTALYLRLYFLSVPSDMIFNFAAAGVRATGNSRLPTLYAAAGGLTNLILNCVFVICFDMDVDGVALATVISKYLSLFLLLRFMLCTQDACHLEPKQLRFHKGQLLPVLQLGVPAAIASCLPSFTTMTMQNSINAFGYWATAGAAATTSILNFAYAAFGAVSSAVSCFTSQNVGAGLHKRVPHLLMRSVSLCLGLSLLFSSVFYFFGEQLLSLFISASDPNRDAIVQQGMINLLYVGVPIYFYGLYSAENGILGGFGRSFSAMLVSLIGLFGFRLLWIKLIFPNLPDPQIQYLYICLPIGMLFTALLCAGAIVITYRQHSRHLEQKISVSL